MSQLSASEGLLQSTPLSQNDENVLPEFTVSDIDSQSQDVSEPKKQKTKYSKSEALSLLKDVGGALVTIKIMKTLPILLLMI